MEHGIGFVHIENDDGQVVFHAHGEGRDIHHREPFLDRFDVRQVLVFRRCRHLLRVGIVNAIDAVFRHQKNFAISFDRPQGARGVRRHEGVAGARGEDHHAALFEVADGPAADVWLRHLRDGQSRLSPDIGASLFEGILERERIHDRAEHPGVIGSRAIHPGLSLRCASPEIAAADGDGDLDARIERQLYLPGDVLEGERIDTKMARPNEGLAT